MTDVVISKTRWTGERIARLGFLVGLGWDAKRISRDYAVASTPNNVHTQARRFGLAFFAARAMNALNLSAAAEAQFEVAAARRGMTREMLIRILLLEIATDPNLLDNILDDGITTEPYRKTGYGETYHAGT